MVPIIYNEDIIVSHLIAKHCLCLLDEVSQRDYNKVGIFQTRSNVWLWMITKQSSVVVQKIIQWMQQSELVIIKIIEK